MFTTEGTTSPLGFFVSTKPFNQFTAFAALTVSLLTWGVCFQPTLHHLWQAWRNTEGLPWGLFVLPGMLWIMLDKRVALARSELVPSLLGVVGFILLSALALVFQLSNIQLLEFIVVIAMLPMMVVALFGYQVSTTLSFALSLPLFLIPFQVFCAQPVHNMIIAAFTQMLVWSNLPIYWQDHLLMMSNAMVRLQEPVWLSNYLALYTLLASCWSYMMFTSVSLMITSLSIAVLGTIGVLLMTATCVTLVGYYAQFDISWLLTQTFYTGWLPSGIFCIWALGCWYSQLKVRSSQDNSMFVWRDHTHVPSYSRWIPLTLCMCTSLFLVPWFSHNIHNFSGAEPTSSNLVLPSVQNWHGPYRHHYSPWQNSLPTLQVEQVSYWQTQEVFHLIGYLPTPTTSQSLVTSLQDLYTEDWEKLYQKHLTLAEKPLTETALATTTEKMLIWSWFEVGKTVVRASFAVKLAEGLHILFKTPKPVLKAIAMPFENHPTEAQQELRALFTEMYAQSSR